MPSEQQQQQKKSKLSVAFQSLHAVNKPEGEPVNVWHASRTWHQTTVLILIVCNSVGENIEYNEEDKGQTKLLFPLLASNAMIR